MRPKVHDIASLIEKIAPLPLQESYDNAGLICGDSTMEVTGVLISFDVIESVIDEAIDNDLNMIVSHHPLVFSGLKKITGKNYIERCLIKAIKNDIAIYAAHTNIDAAPNGLNKLFCNKLGLKNCRILSPSHIELVKLVTFVPKNDATEVRHAIFSAGAGHIGNYDHCSFNIEGEGTFRAQEGTRPHVGEKGITHHEKEIRIEVILPDFIKEKVISAMIQAHPYEEVAYDIFPLKNHWMGAGSGMIGDLPEALDTITFLNFVKDTFKTGSIRHTSPVKDKVKKIALCGGAGSFLISDAIAAKADVFITGEIKYHDFFNSDGKIVLADMGHFESEQFVKELFEEAIKKNFSNFAVRLSEVNTNPINYL